MMRNRLRGARLLLAAGVCGGTLLAPGFACERIFQRELSVLLAPGTEPLLIRDSWLVNVFGYRILQLFGKS